MSAVAKAPKIIVQKYGGATLADPVKIKAVAQRIAEQARSGTKLVVVVSAMGKTTNSLIDLASQVSQNPHQREMDMLLSVGERISMSLMSMALNDLGCAAISFTGSQAGILTNDSHVNAFIVDVKAHRVQEALDQGKVVILAGFQGVSPVTKEITTLGRGGSDTSAVAMSAFFAANRCEILKDVPAVFTADPNVVKEARPLQHLNYDQLMEMTFWGAKVLHYRSVELAKVRKVSLYIGPAATKTSEGTLVEEGLNMFESCKALSLNSHETVLQISCQSGSSHVALDSLKKYFESKQIAFPQLLDLERNDNKTVFLLTGPQEIMTAIKNALTKHQDFALNPTDFSTVTLTCTGSTAPEVPQAVMKTLDQAKVATHKMMIHAMSVTVLVESSTRKTTLQALHALI
ncbi:aspartate kinase [Bdellovibrio sp. HCB337]|uniref:aspartate kinase n=1 Tax=Bdellovibrio sp. HCB337 TaxID=3394358 RepID=UPI0039A6ACCE